MTVSLPLSMCVSCSGILPCVLWTPCVSLLADISKRSRSGEAGYPLSVLQASSAPLAHIQRSFLSPSSSSSSSHFPRCLVFLVITSDSFKNISSQVQRPVGLLMVSAALQAPTVSPSSILSHTLSRHFLLLTKGKTGGTKRE